MGSTALRTGLHVGGTWEARPACPPLGPPPIRDRLGRGKEASCLAALLLQRRSWRRGAEPTPEEPCPWPGRSPECAPHLAHSLTASTQQQKWRKRPGYPVTRRCGPQSPGSRLPQTDMEPLGHVRPQNGPCSTPRGLPYDSERWGCWNPLTPPPGLRGNWGAGQSLSPEAAEPQIRVRCS